MYCVSKKKKKMLLTKELLHGMYLDLFSLVSIIKVAILINFENLQHYKFIILFINNSQYNLTFHQSLHVGASAFQGRQALTQIQKKKEEKNNFLQTTNLCEHKLSYPLSLEFRLVLFTEQCLSWN